MIIVLRIAERVITEARFSTYGCPSAIACGQYVTEQVEGHTCAEAEQINIDTIILGIGNMPLGREHCPKLASDALADALSKYDEQTPVGGAS